MLRSAFVMLCDLLACEDDGRSAELTLRLKPRGAKIIGLLACRIALFLVPKSREKRIEVFFFKRASVSCGRFGNVQLESNCTAKKRKGIMHHHSSFPKSSHQYQSSNKDPPKSLKTKSPKKTKAEKKKKYEISHAPDARQRRP